MLLHIHDKCITMLTDTDRVRFVTIVYQKKENHELHAEGE